MKIIYGNLLNCKSGLIGHQVNCKGVMGAGVALAIRNKYPSVYNAYMRSSMSLGDCQVVPVSKDLYVCNLFGQNNYGKHSVQTDYIALEKALEKMFQTAKDLNCSVNLPFGIGCGLAGGNWNLVLFILHKLEKKYDIDLNLFKL